MIPMKSINGAMLTKKIPNDANSSSISILTMAAPELSITTNDLK